MNKTAKIIFGLFLLILATGFVLYRLPEKYQKAQISEAFTLYKSSELTLEQKIGQIFIVGFKGKTLNPEIESLIREVHPGGVLLLGRNIESKEQLKKLISSIQKISLEETGLPMFIAIDQEGGIVSRIWWAENTAQSKIKDERQGYQVGLERGRTLSDVGINLNFAPLLDIVSSESFIFNRTFQKEAGKVGGLAKALISGQKEAGILTGAKHFPGYGKISFHPEEKLGIVEEIPEVSQFVGTEPEIIMTSNVIFEELDKDLPFSFLSSGIKFLREKVDGDYLIISDDLAQNSLLDRFSLKEIVSLPFNAGTDILIFSGWRIPVEKGITAFKEAVEDGEVSEQRIDQAVAKIIKLKERLNR